MARLARLVLLLLLASPAALAAAGKPAPPLSFAAGTVLAGGYVLTADVTLPPAPGPVILPAREGPLRWRVAVQDGVTRLLQPDGHWAARAEFTETMRDGRRICLVYQTTLSPEWAVHGRERQDHADIAVADDKVYTFRDIPCP